MMNGTESQSANGLSCLGRDQTNEAGKELCFSRLLACKMNDSREENRVDGVVQVMSWLLRCTLLNVITMEVFGFYPLKLSCFHLHYGYRPFL